MAYLGSQANDEFSAGISHQVNPGRANASSITLNDAGLDQTAQHWAATTPHGVLQTALGGSEDASWQAMQRTAGTYQPGSFEGLTDQISQGSDDNAP